jgi:CheY-like chemotaxis protein
VRPIVYIDDERLLCRVFERILKSVGAHVVTFTEPETALAYMRDVQVAAVICDYRMPGLTGLQVLDRIVQDVPFFLITGDLAIAGAEANPRIRGVLTKPFSPEGLIEMVQPYLAIPTSEHR